jgi:polyisoprenoid-binding protein YceI
MRLDVTSNRRTAAAVIVSVLAGGFFPLVAAAAEYKVDPAHTSVTFRVRHLFTWVQGRFGGFEGTIVYDPSDPKVTKVEGSIDVASVDTNVDKRDEHLRSKDFFHVEKYPKITFTSTGVAEVDESKKRGKMKGALSIHGIEKPVVLDVAYLGEATDPWGNTSAAFTAEVNINRKDFGLNWNQTLETGGFLVGDEVQIRIDAAAMPAE